MPLEPPPAGPRGPRPPMRPSRLLGPARRSRACSPPFGGRRGCGFPVHGPCGSRHACVPDLPAPAVPPHRRADFAREPGPAAVLKTFDSLLEAGRVPEARLLCAGQMLRMFDFIALAHAKTAGLLDTSRSRETILEEKDDGTWAYLRFPASWPSSARSWARTPSAPSQAVHLFRPNAPAGRGGWLIAEMEELESEASPVRLRSGSPEGTARAGTPSRDTVRTSALSRFPVSSRAPARAGEADRLRYRLRLRERRPFVRRLPAGSGPDPGPRRLPFGMDPGEPRLSRPSRQRGQGGRHGGFDPRPAGDPAAGHLAHLPVLQRLPSWKTPCLSPPPRASPEPNGFPLGHPGRLQLGHVRASASKLGAVLFGNQPREFSGT